MDPTYGTTARGTSLFFLRLNYTVRLAGATVGSLKGFGGTKFGQKSLQ